MCAFWSEIRVASNLRTTDGRCSPAAMLRSTNCGKECKDIEFLSDPTVGEVRIGTTPPLAASFVFHRHRPAVERYPRIMFRIVAEGGEPTGARLNERRVDLLIFRKSLTVMDDELLSFEPV